MEVEHGEYVADVLVHRAVGDEEPFPDCGVAQSFGHQGEHLPFPGGEPVEAVAGPPAGEQLGDHLGIDGGPATGYPVQRVQETRYPPLQEWLIQLLGQVPLDTQLPPLPYDLTVDSVSAQPDGIVVMVSATDVPLAR